jgi:DNA-binding response OmpR family regulator
MAQGRLLILDDDATVGQVLVAGARVSAFEARLCTALADFLAALAAFEPTHLAIDLTLPECSGIEVLRQVAAAGCRARVIVCSGAGAADLD